jgi:hypothetical protein
MTTREIHPDPDADQILSSVAATYGGDRDLALADILHAHQSVEALLDQPEFAHSDELARQKEKSERGFAEGRFTTREEVKRPNRL